MRAGFIVSSIAETLLAKSERRNLDNVVTSGVGDCDHFPFVPLVATTPALSRGAPCGRIALYSLDLLDPLELAGRASTITRSFEESVGIGQIARECPLYPAVELR